MYCVASRRHIAGISDKMAKKIVERRMSDGAFICRSQLLSVAGLGPKTFEQCAGFLRIMPHCDSDPVEGFARLIFVIILIHHLYCSHLHHQHVAVLIFGTLFMSRVHIVPLVQQQEVSPAGKTLQQFPEVRFRQPGLTGNNSENLAS